ncbi:hypothetical protein [Kineosporia sp. NBRC 101731]|uniref:hypothetical protein n=1 Tax=Kineosporia sp. NBRC 101731 TaxID=3032199 RepID=UPI00249FAB39|nr:hypothetical protein [Kineosporia sp. NBRC 101731]GLY29869.1 hypothetical protein Kisp02_32340 [Kineosporia sp. NBRC 101731]
MTGFSFSGSFFLTIVLVVEALVVLGFVGRWYGRKWGWRNTFGRLRQYFRETAADLARPLLRWHRFSGDVRLLARELTDPDLGGILRAATADALHRSTEPDDLRCHAALSGAEVVAVLPAAPTIPSTPLGFREAHGWWVAARSGMTPILETGMVGHLAVGTTRAALPGTPAVLFLNLWEAPGVVELSGPPRPVHSLLCAISAQLLGGLAGHGLDLIVTSGVHPGFRGPDLDTVLERLQTRLDHPPAERMVVLVCSRMSPAQAQTLAWLVSVLPELRVVTSGPYPGRRWKLPIDADGRLDAPDLELTADSAPVEKAVARVLARGPRRPNPAAPQQTTPQPTLETPISAAAPITGRPAAASPAAWDDSYTETPGPAWQSEQSELTELSELVYEDDEWARPEKTFTADSGFSSASASAAAWPDPTPPSTAPTAPTAPTASTAPRWSLDEPEPADDFTSGASAGSAGSHRDRSQDVL